MCDVTRILGKIEAGDPSAAEQLLPLVYEELRKLAAAKMAQEKPGQTLQATALVHEAYIRLVDVEKAQHWDSRGALLCCCRRGDAADSGGTGTPKSRPGSRRRTSACGAARCGSGDRWSVDWNCLPSTRRSTSLAVKSTRAQAELVKLRFFAGLTDRRGRRGSRDFRPQLPTAIGLTPSAGCESSCPKRETVRSTAEMSKKICDFFWHLLANSRIDIVGGHVSAGVRNAMTTASSMKSRSSTSARQIASAGCSG